MDNDTKKHEIVIYSSENGDITLEADIKRDTLWATQAQISELFDIDRTGVARHIKNIYETGELDEKVVSAKFAHTTAHGALAGKTQTRDIKVYNLDMVLSVGYRVNSAKATDFRKWANSVLKDYLLKGAAINQKRLEQLGKYLEIVSRSEISEVAGVGELMMQYVDALRLLEQYDEGKLATPHGSDEKWQLTYDEARKFLDELKTSESFGDNFASERSQHFSGIVAGIYQTFDGKELYASVEEKAVNLLYQIVKDHPFVDGNKRSGAALFVYFLARNSVLRDINSNTLAATTLLVALSKPEEKDQILLLIRNFFEGEVKKK